MSEVIHHTQETNEKQEGIKLTVAAVNHLIHYLSSKKNCRGVRLSVKTTGCSGLSYVIEPLFEVNEEDFHFSITEQLELYIDRKSYPFLKGLNIDYRKEDGINAKFVYNNPNQTGQCGCGESFTVS